MWIQMAQDRLQWKTVVQAVLNLRTPWKVGLSMIGRVTATC